MVANLYCKNDCGSRITFRKTWYIVQLSLKALDVALYRSNDLSEIGTSSSHSRQVNPAGLATREYVKVG